MWRAMLGILAGVVGLAVSAALSVEHAAMGGGAGVGVWCGDGGGCAAVLGSRWAYVGAWTGGLIGRTTPLAHVGVVFYAVAVAVWVVSLGMGWRSARWAGLGVGVVGAAASAAFVGVQLVAVRAVCPLCMTSAAASVGLLVAAVLGERGGEGRGWPGLAVGVCALGVVGAAGLWVWGLQSGMLGAGDPGGRSGDRRVLARLDGLAITEADFRREAGEEAYELEVRAYEARARYVERKVAGLMLEVEARRRGMTRDELLEAEVEGPLRADRASAEETARAMSPEEADRAGRIAENILGELRLAKEVALLERLRERHRLEWVMRAPLGRRVELDRELVNAAWAEGERGTRGVEVVVFSDLECPLCAELDGVLGEVRRRMGGGMVVRFMHFPLGGRAWSEEAAVVGEAVRARGGDFGVYKREIYRRQGRIDREAIEEAARAALGERAAGVDIGALREDAAAGALVRRMARHARELRLGGAPTVVVEGRVLGGFMEAEELERRARAILDERR